MYIDWRNISHSQITQFNLRIISLILLVYIHHSKAHLIPKSKEKKIMLILLFFALRYEAPALIHSFGKFVKPIFDTVISYAMVIAIICTGIAILLTIVGVKFHGPSLGTVILKGVFSAIAGISKAFAKAISWIAKTFVRMLGKIFNSLKKEHPILAVVVTAIVAIIVI
ncbi:unknown [Clostridium sp. CAG:571]|nr:unknown [Clostridium sp. CAG:571]